MSASEVLRKKLGGRASGAPGFAGEGAQGAEKAWPLSLARAARDCFALSLEITEMTTRRCAMAELAEHVPERAMIAMLDGPREALGILVLSPELLSGLIEMQTLGLVREAGPAPRKPTRTDAAMVAEWIDRALVGLEVQLRKDPDLPWADYYRYASFLDDPRPLRLLLDDVPFRMISVTCDLARGTKKGSLVLALPAEGRGRRPAGTADRPIAMPPSFDEMMRARIAEAECQLQTTIARIRLPLGEVLELQPDQVLALGEAGIDRILVEAGDGRPLAYGKLGQQRGNRAVRLAEVLSPGGALPADTSFEASDSSGAEALAEAAPLGGFGAMDGMDGFGGFAAPEGEEDGLRAAG